MMTTAAMPHRMDRDVHLRAGVSRVDLPHADHVGHESGQTDDRRGDRDALRPGQHPGGRIHEGGMDPPEPPAMKGVGRAMFGGPPVVAVSHVSSNPPTDVWGMADTRRTQPARRVDGRR